MKLKRFSLGTLGLLAVSGLASSCSSKSEDCNANLNCGPYSGEVGTSGASGASGAGGKSGASGESGASGTGGGASGEGGTDPAAGSGGAAPPKCDGTLAPDVDACVISDEFGIFVAPTGGDATTADGTQAHPYATLTAALARFEKKIKHVYVCAADYEEPNMLEIPDGVSIYGGFTCEGGTWKYDAGLPAHLLPKSPVGAMITDAKVGVVLQDLRIDAANADDGTDGAPGGSSFGMMLNASKVLLKRVVLNAGKGGAGAAGKNGLRGDDGKPSGIEQNGNIGTCTSAPNFLAPGISLQPICTSQGGNGGQGYNGDQLSTVRAGVPGSPGPLNGGVPPMKATDPPGVGGGGQSGDAGVHGVAASAVGTFSDSGYMPANGGNGTSGKPGQGGGGGASGFAGAGCVGSSGGAGGMGGCGGDPGTGGMGGGASVALLSWQSSLTIESCTLTANSGGAGGGGGTAHIGGAGKPGGSGGATDSTNKVGKGGGGGDGGNGGNGGNGAGGTGGPSIALVHDATAPTLVGASTFKFGSTAAAAGKGGMLGSSSDDYGPDGAKGLTQDIYSKM